MSDCLDLGYHPLFEDGDYLYRRVLPVHMGNGFATAAHCQTKHWREGLSCDWSVLSTPFETALRQGGAIPASILRVSIGDCVDLGIDVRYCPVTDSDHPDFNLAHCLLFPPNPSKSAVAKLREAFLIRSEVVSVRHRFPNWILTALSRFNHKRRGAMSHIHGIVIRQS